MQINRRYMLRSLGVSVALPWLEAMLPSVAHAAPSTFKPWPESKVIAPRMICCYVPNGVNIAEWIPTTKGKDYQLSPTLNVLKSHQKDFTVLSGLGHPHSTGGHVGADTWLTGANLKSKPGCDYTNSISADQVVAEVHGKFTRYASLQLSDMSGTGGAGHSHTLSFDRNGTPLPAENSPRRLFERLFVPESASDKAALLKRYAERRSILDDISSEAKALSSKVSTVDKAKLDEYFASVRETEKQIERMQKWVDVPKPKVTDAGLQLASQPMNGHDRPMWLDVMLELSYLAFITDTTRVITFEWSREAGGFGGGGENHHELSHHNGDPKNLGKLAEIDRFHLSKLGRFMEFLKATKEGPGSMLDSTMIFYGSGMNSGTGTGDHSPKNLPILLAGGSRLGLKHGQHVAHSPEKHPPLTNVLMTMMQKMGVEAKTGFSDATGVVGEVVLADSRN
jgi:hypothetical protein